MEIETAISGGRKSEYVVECGERRRTSISKSESNASKPYGRILDTSEGLTGAEEETAGDGVGRGGPLNENVSKRTEISEAGSAGNRIGKEKSSNRKTAESMSVANYTIHVQSQYWAINLGRRKRNVISWIRLCKRKGFSQKRKERWTARE